MSDKIVVTSEADLQRIVDESVERAMQKAIEASKMNDKFIDEKEAMDLWFIKDKRTLYKRVRKYKIETFFIDNKKVFKEKDIKSIIQA